MPSKRKEVPKTIGRTKTSPFGTSGRRSHDSSEFYGRKLYEGEKSEKFSPYLENQISSQVLDKIFRKSSEKMDDIPDSSVHLIVTSPPYNSGKDYDQDLDLAQYRDLLKTVMSEGFRVLVPGGRLCLNLANLGRKPYIPLHAFLIQDLLDLGFLMRGEIIWDKSSSSGSSTAWGSWKSPSNPTLRDSHEYILIFSKDNFRRPSQLDKIGTITRKDFLESTQSIWRFPSVSAKRIGHPAPFPVELPRRCIELFTYSDEIVLDPFMGSGTTAIASLETNRRFVGYETDKKYVLQANSRIQKWHSTHSISENPTQRTDSENPNTST